MTSNEPRASSPCTLALDLGTTTLVGRLLTGNGTFLAEARSANPQRAFGADILTRLQHARSHGGAELQQLLVDAVRSLVAILLARAGCGPQQVVAAAAAGNPGVCHLLLGLPVDGILFPPHRTPLTGLTLIDREQLDFRLPCPLHLFPAVSGFVGGDLVAVLYGAMSACGAGDWYTGALVNALNGEPATITPMRHYTHERALPGSLVLDLGTNAEIALWTGRHWLATSAAAGPAFEAGNIACGMPLAPGAVVDVQLAGERLQLAVHGGGRPEGLCGSGLLALVAAARRGGLIDADGRIVAPEEVGTNLARYLVAEGEGWTIRFHRDARGELCLKQDDVRQLQLAKGAVRAGVEVLLDRAGVAPDDLGSVLITGAFGSSLPVAAVKGIALLPEAMLDKLLCVPNGVLDGLAAFLVDPRGEERLAALRAGIKPFPLSGTPAFEERFLGALGFG